MLRNLLITGTLLVSLTWAHALLAADPAAAEALFKAGKEAVAKGDLETGCAKLRESYEIDPAPGTAFNLAECEEKRGKIATAWGLFEEVRQRLPPSDERVPTVEKRVALLAPRLPKLAVRLEGPPGATVKRGNTILKGAALGQPLPVDPGEHTLTVELAGHSPSQTTAKVAEGESKEVVLVVGPKVPAAPPDPQNTSEAEDGLGLTIGGFVLGGLGLAGVGAGIGLGLLAKSQYDDVADQCPDNQCSGAAFEERNGARTLGDGATVAVAIGGAAAATGVVLVVLGFTQSGAYRSEAPRVSLPLLAPIPGGAALSWGIAL